MLYCIHPAENVDEIFLTRCEVSSVIIRKDETEVNFDIEYLPRNIFFLKTNLTEILDLPTLLELELGKEALNPLRPYKILVPNMPGFLAKLEEIEEATSRIEAEKLQRQAIRRREFEEKQIKSSIASFMKSLMASGLLRSSTVFKCFALGFDFEIKEKKRQERATSSQRLQAKMQIPLYKIAEDLFIKVVGFEIRLNKIQVKQLDSSHLLLRDHVDFLKLHSSLVILGFALPDFPEPSEWREQLNKMTKCLDEARQKKPFKWEKYLVEKTKYSKYSAKLEELVRKKLGCYSRYMRKLTYQGEIRRSNPFLRFFTIRFAKEAVNDASYDASQMKSTYIEMEGLPASNEENQVQGFKKEESQRVVKYEISATEEVRILVKEEFSPVEKEPVISVSDSSEKLTIKQASSELLSEFSENDDFPVSFEANVPVVEAYTVIPHPVEEVVAETLGNCPFFSWLVSPLIVCQQQLTKNSSVFCLVFGNVSKVYHSYEALKTLHFKLKAKYDNNFLSLSEFPSSEDATPQSICSYIEEMFRLDFLLLDNCWLFNLGLSCAIPSKE